MSQRRSRARLNDEMSAVGRSGATSGVRGRALYSGAWIACVAFAVVVRVDGGGRALAESGADAGISPPEPVAQAADQPGATAPDAGTDGGRQDAVLPVPSSQKPVARSPRPAWDPLVAVVGRGRSRVDEVVLVGRGGQLFVPVRAGLWRRTQQGGVATEVVAALGRSPGALWVHGKRTPVYSFLGDRYSPFDLHHAGKLQSADLVQGSAPILAVGRQVFTLEGERWKRIPLRHKVDRALWRSPADDVLVVASGSRIVAITKGRERATKVKGLAATPLLEIAGSGLEQLYGLASDGALWRLSRRPDKVALAAAVAQALPASLRRGDEAAVHEPPVGGRASAAVGSSAAAEAGAKLEEEGAGESEGSPDAVAATFVAQGLAATPDGVVVYGALRSSGGDRPEVVGVRDAGVQRWPHLPDDSGAITLFYVDPDGAAIAGDEEGRVYLLRDGVNWTRGDVDEGSFVQRGAAGPARTP